MKLNPVKVVLTALIGITVVVGVLFQDKFIESGEPVSIAVVAPITGPDASVGKSVVHGVKALVDTINESGGIHGRKIRIALFDDQNKKEVAVEMAGEIAADDDILAVIGHYNSTCSIAAGKIYEENGIPAISPASTDVRLTRDNPWYFRTLFNDEQQARFLVNYAWKVFGLDGVSIIFEDDEYGRYIAQAVENTTGSIGIDLRYKWMIGEYGRTRNQEIRRIVSELQGKQDTGAVILAMRAKTGVEVVKLMKDTLIKIPILVPDSFGTKVFSAGFSELKKEKRTPGFYTNGVQVASPMVFDTGNEAVLEFMESFREKFHEDPDWIAASAYDSAMLIAEALKSMQFNEIEPVHSKYRKTIREFLSGIRSPKNAIQGITGPLYFDEERNARKPIYLGVYKNNKIISSLVQFLPVRNPNLIPDLKKEIDAGRIILFNGGFHFKTNVVYTGVRIDEISNLDLDNMTCVIDFSLWFRYQGDIDPSQMEFLNAAEPISVGDPVETLVSEDLVSKRYHVRKKFSISNASEPDAFGNLSLGFQFRHRELTRNNLVYVPDTLSMSLAEKELNIVEKNLERLTNQLKKWRVENIRLYHDREWKDTLGNLYYLDLQRQQLDYSRFNCDIPIRKKLFTLRRTIPRKNAIDLIILCSVFMLLIEIAFRKRLLPRYPRAIWCVQFFLTGVLLLSAEVFFLDLLTGEIETYYLRTIVTIFDILWWLVPALYIHLALHPFVWMPMEKKNERPVPNILRRFFAYLIYFFALYGIVVHVFDQNITKLMATSGAIAMVIGFLIKANISNFFAGIVINQGDTLRIGDVVKIGSFDPGEVVDINWRTTNLEKSDGSIMSIPNSVVSDSIIHNYNLSGDQYSITFFVHVDQSHPPERIITILKNALNTAKGVLPDPKPGAFFSGFSEWSAQYAVNFTVNGYEQRYPVGEQVWKAIWTHLNMAGIRPAVKMSGFHGDNTGTADGRYPITALAVLHEMDIFRPLSDEMKLSISRIMRKRKAYSGTVVVQQEEEGTSLFIVAEGAVLVSINREEEGLEEIARMGPGSIFGEMALLTGKPRNATVTAIRDTELFEIRREDFIPFLRDDPELCEQLSQIIAERKIQDGSVSQESQMKKPDKKTVAEQILNKIRQSLIS